MLQKIFRVSLERPPPGLELCHPLHVALEKSYLSNHKILKNDMNEKEWFIGALMREYPLIYESIDCMFIHVHIIDSNIHAGDGDNIHLYVTENFLLHYSHDYNDICYFKSVFCCPLEKIVIGAKSTESFNWFQDQDVYKKLLVQTCQRNILCRQDDMFLASPVEFSSSEVSHFLDYVTLDCQPLRQGLLFCESSFVIADIRDVCNHNSKNEKSVKNRTDQIFLYTNLISYTSRNFLGLHLPGTSLPQLSASSSSLKSFSFRIHVMPKFNADFKKELLNLSREADPLSIVFISCNSLKKLNVANGSWVSISISDSVMAKPRHFMLPVSIIPTGTDPKLEKKANVPSRLAFVCAFTNEKLSDHYFEDEELAYISPLLWFNLNPHPSVLMQPQCRLQIKPLDSNCSPPFAKEAYACLIQSPHYDGKVNCKIMLSKYFATPRFVCKGDIFAVNSRDQLDFHVNIQDEEVDKTQWPVVYFRITMIDGPPSSSGYLISTQHTRLYQSGTKQSYVPLTMETYYQSTPYHPIWSSIPDGLSRYINQLQDLILPFLKLQSAHCQMSCNILFTGSSCCGKSTVIKAVSRCLNLHLYQVNCYELGPGETSAVTEARLKNKIDKGSIYAPCIIVLKNIHCIGREREAIGEDSRVLHSLANLLKNVNNYGSDWPIIVIGTTTDAKLVSSNLISAFLYSVHMEAPNEDERCSLLFDLLSACDVSNDVSIHYLAQRTAGFILGDLWALVNQGIRNAYSRIKKLVDDQKLNKEEEEDIVLASVPVIQRDLLNALEKLQSEFAEAIGAPKIPNVKFEDIGGLSDVKQEILDTIQLPLEHPEILSSGLRRSGVLLYGPPGSGKTLLAKAVATECALNFLSVKGPELINMYVGQSEENVRAVFNQARSAVPCIIFFDELDSLAPNRGRSGDSGGVMDRVVSQLLAELDGLNKKSEVFVIGATNRPDLIDPALLRPGRFDRLLYVGIPEDKASKLSILKALMRKIPLAENVDLEEIIDRCPPHLSGADFYSLCSNAVIKRVEKNVELLEKGDEDIHKLNCDVQTEDFLSAMESLVPSVSPEQYQQYQQVKSRIENE